MGEENNEILEKGSLQRKLAFKPTDEQARQQAPWTSEQDSDVRDNLAQKGMEPAAKTRALNKLMAVTQVRRHPETGERLFLMHRGMGTNEFRTRHNHEQGVTKYGPEEHTSWSPHHDIASENADNDQLVSAWIPESALSHTPHQYNKPIKQTADAQKPEKSTIISREHEWIVNHDKPFQHAHPKLVGLKMQKSEHKDQIPGGKADKKQPKDFDTEQLEMGIKVEMEHTKDRTVAEEIAMDHLQEFSNYYSALKVMEDYLSMKGKHKNLHDILEQRLSKKIKKSEDILRKGALHNFIRNSIAGTGLLVGANQAFNFTDKPDEEQEPEVRSLSVQQPQQSEYHHQLFGQMKVKNAGTGKPLLNPVVARQTIQSNPELMNKYSHMLKLKGKMFDDAMKETKGFEEEVGSAHMKKLGEIFNNDPHHMQHAWNNGVQKTKQAIKSGINIEALNHKSAE